MNMRTSLFALGLVLAAGAVAAKDEYASAKDAEAMVGRAVAALKSSKDKTIEEINQKSAQWVDRDLYAVIYDINGNVVAHGANIKMVGKDLIDFKDPDGKLFVKERVDLAKSKGKFWQDYKFTDPLTKKMLAKTAYCEKTGEVIVCAGVYKR